jgi:hypothetical protein
MGGLTREWLESIEAAPDRRAGALKTIQASNVDGPRMPEGYRDLSAAGADVAMAFGSAPTSPSPSRAHRVVESYHPMRHYEFRGITYWRTGEQRPDRAELDRRS